jgi:hypothetical protein
MQKGMEEQTTNCEEIWTLPPEISNSSFVANLQSNPKEAILETIEKAMKKEITELNISPTNQNRMIDGIIYREGFGF